MPIDLNIPFPSEAEALRKQAEVERDWTPTQRLRAMLDLLAAGEKLSKAGTIRIAQLKYHDELEKEENRRMMEVIAQHVVRG